MKIAQLKFFVLLFSFEILFTLSIDTLDSGYNEFYLQTGVTELTYLVKEASLIDGKSPFLSFVTFEDNISMAIKEIEENKFEIIPKNEWVTMPLIYFQILPELYSCDTLTLVLKNNNSFPVQFIFIDNSNELNISLEKFLDWKYKITHEKYDGGYAPTPLIFSIDEVNNDTNLEIYFNYDDEIYDDSSDILYYCINEGSDCQYYPYTNQMLKKGQKYKFKLNCFIDKTDKSYYFYIPYKLDDISYPTDINEINFGITNFDKDENEEKKYFIANIKGLKNFYVWVIYSSDSKFGYQLISKSQKENINEEIYNIRFNYRKYSDIVSISNPNDNDYLILKINNLESDNKGSIMLLNEMIYLVEPRTFFFEKGTYSLFFYINQNGWERNYLISTRKNMAFLNDNDNILVPPINIEYYTDNFIFEENGEYKIIYADSSDRNSTIEFKSPEADKEFIEFNLEELVEFDFKERRQFKLNYKQEGESPLIINFMFYNFNRFVLIVDNENNRQQFIIDINNSPLNITFSMSGTYYFYFKLLDEYDYGYEYFTTYIPNKVIYTDLSQKYYFDNKEFFSNSDLEPKIIKVQNLKEDKCIFLNYKVVDGEDIFDLETEDLENPFEICKDNSNEKCSRNLNLFCFSKIYNYTIKIHFSQRKDKDYSPFYYIPTFEFYTFSKDSIKGKEKKIYSSSEIQLFNFNLEKNEELFLATLNNKGAYICYSDEENFILNNISYIELKTINSEIKKISGHKYVLILIIPGNNDYETKVILADKLLKQNNVDHFNISKGENAIIYLEEDIEEEEEDNEEEDDRDNLRRPLKLRRMSTDEEEYKEEEHYEEMWKEEEYEEMRKEEKYYEEEGKEEKYYEEEGKEEKDYEEEGKEEKDYEEEDKEEKDYEEEDKEEKPYEEEWKEEKHYEEEWKEEKHYEEEWKEDDEGEDHWKDDDDDDYLINHLTLTVFSSQEKNMELFTLSSPGEKTNLICQNSYPMIIYVDKIEKNNTISIKKYEPKYAFFLAINNNQLLKAYIDMIKIIYEEDEEDHFDLKKFFPLNIRLNSDMNVFYDFINLYFSDIKEKIIVYIKKFYGGTDLYECDIDLKEVSDYSLITKPLPPCKNKKSIFNRIIKLEDIKLLSGYLGPNSYFDIYLDIEEFSGNKVINPFSNIFGQEEFGFSYGARYLEKDIEYTLNITGQHIIKLEPGFDAEVEIYNEKKKVILNSKNLTREIEGKNLKIKAKKNNAMVYFYGKLSDGIKQIKIDPRYVGKNYKITIPNKVPYIFDFGFEGYYFSNLFEMSLIDYENHYETIYLENIYDKLKDKLVDGENFYLYYFGNDDVEVEYSSVNINPSNNEFTFNVIQKNVEEQNLIINNLNKNKIKYQVNYCSSSNNKIKLFYQSIYDFSENEREFTENKIIEETIKEGTIKLWFESNEDFVFSYSFVDEFDERFNETEKWWDERKETNNLIINKINKKENSNLYTLNFNANYRNSSTRYIIVIAPKNEKYTNETLSNPCFITKLVTEKSKEVKIINIVDIGENEYIDVDVDLYSTPEYKGEYIIGIISQELRFEKKLNFYKAFEFIENELIPKEIDNIGKEQEFDLSKNEAYFSMMVKNKSEHNEMLLLHYKVEQSGSFIIQLYGPKGNGESFEISDDEGFINFLYDGNGTYAILFRKEENKLLRSLSNTETSIIGKFQIFTTETPFDLDLANDNIEFKEFNITNAKNPSLKFNIKPDKDYIKKISIANHDFSNINEIVSINENNLGDKSLNFTYYTFENNSNYQVTIKFKPKGEDSYTLENVNILGYSSIEQNSISSGIFTYNDDKDRFLTIDWENLKKVIITIKSKEPVLLISEITKSQSENLVKEFKNLKFEELKNLTLTKPEKSRYSLLMIEPEVGTQINVELKKEDDDDDDGKSWVIILIIVLAIIVFIVVLILILGYIRRKNQDIDFKKKAEDIQQETLLKDI